MSRRKKLLDKLRHNPKGVRFEELAKLLEWYGFELKRVQGSHYSYKRGSRHIVVVRRAHHVHSEAVREVLGIIDEILEEE